MKSLIPRLALSIASGLVALSSLAALAGDDVIFPRGPIVRNEVEAGAEISYYACPCLRWTVSVDLGEGQYETKNFVISTDALFRFYTTETIEGREMASRLFRVGAIEALIKGAHVGLGFDGITLGEDRDKGYSDILRTGVYVLLNVFRTEMARLDLRTGTDFEQMRVNESPLRNHERATETVALTIGRPESRVHARLRGTVSYELAGAAAGQFGYQAAAEIQGDIVRFWDLGIGLGAHGTYTYDPLQKAFGLDPHLAVAGIYLDVAYIAGKKADQK